MLAHFLTNSWRAKPSQFDTSISYCPYLLNFLNPRHPLQKGAVKKHKNKVPCELSQFQVACLSSSFSLQKPPFCFYLRKASPVQPDKEIQIRCSSIKEVAIYMKSGEGLGDPLFYCFLWKIIKRQGTLSEYAWVN